MVFGMSERSSTISRRWSGCSAEDLAHPAEQPARGLHAGAGDHGDEGEDLVRGQPADRAGEVLELDVQQLGDEVVGRVLRPPGDVVGVGVAVEVVIFADEERFARLVPQSCSTAWSRTAGWSASGMPTSMPIARIGISAPRSSTKSNRPEPTRGSKHAAQNARICCSSRFMRFGVNARDTRARCMVWSGGSSLMNTPGGISGRP